VDSNVAERIGNIVARGVPRKMSSSWLASSRLLKTKTLTLLLTTSSTITTRCFGDGGWYMKSMLKRREYGEERIRKEKQMGRTEEIKQYNYYPQ